MSAVAGDGGPLRARMGRPELVILALALLLRAIYASVADTTLWFDHVFNDATAMGLLEGRGFTVSLEPPFAPGIFRTPGYSVFLAMVYGVAGHSVRAALFANALLDTATCWLLFRLALPRVGAAAARWVLLVAATYPFFVHAVGLLSPESLSTFLAVVLLALLESWPAARGWGRVVATGCVLAALGWVKPVFLPLPAFVLLAEWLRGRPLGLTIARCTTVGVLGIAAIAPWVARNHELLGRPMLAGELGIVVWHGTLDFDESRDEIIRESFERARGRSGDHYEDARAWFADPVAELEAADVFMERGTRRIRERPLRAFVLDPLRRIPRLWVSTTYAIGPWWIGAGAAVACVAYLIAGLLGLARLRGRWREMAAWWVLPVQLTLVYGALHVEARYTLPARPTLILLAGVGLHAVWTRVTTRPAASG